VAYTPYRHRGPRKPGRPRVYGKKLKLRTLLQDPCTRGGAWSGLVVG
jgi:hypothetical protein